MSSGTKRKKLNHLKILTKDPGPDKYKMVSTVFIAHFYGLTCYYRLLLYLVKDLKEQVHRKKRENRGAKNKKSLLPPIV